MRMTGLVVAVVLSMLGPAVAQEWTEYSSTQDGFKVAFPGQPRITETTWTTKVGYTLPARVYSAEREGERYSMTVVDYSGIEKLGLERLKTCPPGEAFDSSAYCRTGDMYGPYYAFHDERGAIVYATFKLLQRNARLDELAWEWQDYVEGHAIQLTNIADESHTAIFVAMLAHKLYIMEGTTAKQRPPPVLFQQSLGWVDKDGKPIRFTIIYSNRFHGMGVYPVPPLTGGGQGAGAGAAGGGTNVPAPGGR